MRIGQISLACHSGGRQPELVPGGVRLAAEVTWTLEAPPEVLSQVREVLADLLDMHTACVASLRFGNAVGSFRVPHLGLVEVHSGKWTSGHFNRMLAELTEIAAALPFSAKGASALPYDRCVPLSRDLLYHALVYLRHVVLEIGGDRNLVRAYDVVLADPHQRLTRAERRVAPELARSVGAGALERLVSGGARLTRAPAGCRAPLAVALAGHLPEAVHEEVAERFLDTAENRFAKAFLDQAMDLARQGERELGGSGAAAARRIADDCREIRRRLEAVARHRFWREIGPLVTLPEGSTVLQRRRGYRELFEHFAKLRLAARVPLTARDARQLLEARDIATLYELWCFFKVVQAVATTEGPAAGAEAFTDDALEVRVPHGYLVWWRSGTRVAYNPRFSRGSASRRSFSVPLRPDISLGIPEGRPSAGLHLLDAKFKIDNLRELLRGDLDEDPDALGRSSFTRADLYKMHTYRDAIPEARSVWILYPGDKFAFFDAGLCPVPKNRPEGLAHPIEGVGAVALRPETEGDDALRGVIARLTDSRALSPK